VCNNKLTQFRVKPPGGDVIILFQSTVFRKRDAYTDWLTDLKLRPIAAQKMDTDSSYRSQLELSITACQRKKSEKNIYEKKEKRKNIYEKKRDWDKE